MFLKSLSRNCGRNLNKKGFQVLKSCSILIILLIFVFFTYDKFSLIGDINIDDSLPALREERYKIHTCFTKFEKIDQLYICGRSHDLVPQLNPNNFHKEVNEFLRMFHSRMDNFVSDGSINARYSLWSFLRILQPSHVIESGANYGYGTWLIRKALPNARITVVSPKTPSKYIDKKIDSKYYTAKNFIDFGEKNWSKEGIDFDKTVIYFDDHQSVYKRITEAKKAGFKHLIFDDNYLAGSTNGSNNNLSIRQACDFGGCLSSLSKEFETLEYVDNFGKFRKNFSDEIGLKDIIGLALDKYIKIIYEPPYLCDILTYPNNTQELITHTLYRNTIRPLLSSRQCVNLKRNLRLLERHFISYANLVYVKL